MFINVHSDFILNFTFKSICVLDIYTDTNIDKTT